ARLVRRLLRQHVDAVVVLAAEPQLALAGDPDRGGGLAAAALRVRRGDHQVHFARLTELRLAQQQPARVALALADAAQLLQPDLVVIGVEAADHALAAGGHDPRAGADLQRHAGRRLAIESQRQRLEAQLAAGGYPAFGVDAGDHGRRPQR